MSGGDPVGLCDDLTVGVTAARIEFVFPEIAPARLAPALHSAASYRATTATMNNLGLVAGHGLQEQTACSANSWQLLDLSL